MRKPDSYFYLNILSFSVSLVFSFTFCLLLTAYCLLFPNVVTAEQTVLPEHVCFHEQCLTVEIADNNEERTRGLQAREFLPEGEGMLFIFPATSVYRFWMKDTLIALDMVFLDEDRRIVGIERDVPPCEGDPCPEYGPAQRSLYVLEANAGYADGLGLKAGDQAVFK